MTPRTKPLRADAARNRDKLLVAATQVFGERGIDAPLEEIARRAGVSIGTLYNHFPSRESFLDVIVPERLAALDQIATTAMADPDPWNGFVGFLEGLFTLQAEDHGLNEAMSRQFPQVADVSASCPQGFRHAEQIIARAKESGDLRADFESQDLVIMIWAMSQVIRESAATAPLTWQRCLTFFLQGLRIEAERP